MSLLGNPYATLSRDPRRAYRVVDQFEDELADYTGAPYAVTVDSCTNAIYVSLMFWRLHQKSKMFEHLLPRIDLPRRTYVGVLQAVRNAGFEPLWTDEDWSGSYALRPTPIVDSARELAPGMYRDGSLTTLSFHAAKQLPLGRGGAILTDDPVAAEWLRAARMDGRPPGAPIEDTLPFGAHCPLPPDTAARGLWILSRWNDGGYSPPPLPDENYPDLSVL